MNTNGAMKLSAFFANNEHPYPNPELAVESIKKLHRPEGALSPSGAMKPVR